MLLFKAIKEHAAVRILYGRKVIDTHQIWRVIQRQLRQCSASDLFLQREDTIIYNTWDLSLSFKVKFANVYSKGLTFQDYSFRAAGTANNLCGH